jgi:hypothetical protein
LSVVCGVNDGSIFVWDEIVTASGAGVVSVTAGVPTTPSGALCAAFVAAFSAFLADLFCAP